MGRENTGAPGGGQRTCVFHVKHLFADAEFSEDLVQDILDIDPPGDAAESAGGEAKVLGLELRRRGRPG